MNRAAHYTLGDSDEEHRRLIALASHEEARVIDACARAGIGRGASVLDAGCGPLGALAALSSVVGRNGRVVGVDANDAALSKARTLVGDGSGIDLVAADVNELTPEMIGGERFDLVYSRLMLLHQSDPESTVARLVTLLRPGGVFIAHEASDLLMHAPASEPSTPAMTRVWELVIAAARSRGADTSFARNGRGVFAANGLTIESHSAYAVHYPPEIGFEIPRVALHSLGPVIAEHALASEEEIRALDEELQAAKQHRGVQWVSSPTMFEWIGRLSA